MQCRLICRLHDLLCVIHSLLPFERRLPLLLLLSRSLGFLCKMLLLTLLLCKTLGLCDMFKNLGFGRLLRSAFGLLELLRLTLLRFQPLSLPICSSRPLMLEIAKYKILSKAPVLRTINRVPGTFSI